MQISKFFLKRAKAGMHACCAIIKSEAEKSRYGQEKNGDDRDIYDLADKISHNLLIRLLSPICQLDGDKKSGLLIRS